MKTSIFDMTLTLPPLIGIHEVEKDMPTNSVLYLPPPCKPTHWSQC